MKPTVLISSTDVIMCLKGPLYSGVMITKPHLPNFLLNFAIKCEVNCETEKNMFK